MQGRLRFATMAVMALAMAGTFSAPAAEEAENEPTIRLPVSFDSAWYRPAVKSGFGNGRQKGLLTVSEEGLEFAAKKQSDFVPWSRVEMLSYGTMRGDADTRWVVFGLTPVAGERPRAGVRDGRKMGYGKHSDEMFEVIAAAMKQVGAGPYDVPAGTTPYTALNLQFSLAIPEGWGEYEISTTVFDRRPLWGQMIFSPLDLAGMRGDVKKTDQAMRALGRGEQPSIYLLRYEAPTGFTCETLKKAARRALRDEIDAAFRPWRLATEPTWTEREHRGCTAWTSNARVENESAGVDVEFFVVSDGQTVYALAWRGPAEGADRNRFEAFVSSLRTAVAR